MLLHPDILWQIAAEGGGRVVLVTGAGCGIEAPTGLRPGRWYAEDAHRRLVEDNVLGPTDCSDPSDLSVVASTVFDVTGSQLELTRRLPRERWRNATPNLGHLTAAALLIEGAVRVIVTLNYDRAQATALAMLGCPAAVAVIHGPEEHERMGARALVYLHRSVDSDEKSWILRKEVLDTAWKEGWEEIVARGALSAPITIFVGLGSPAAVLTETVKRLSAAEGVAYYYADPSPDNEFTEAIADHLAETYEVGWCELAAELGDRVARELAARLATATRDLAATQHRDDSVGDLALAALAPLSLVQLGMVRAAWLAMDPPYRPHQDGAEATCVAHLILTLGSLAKDLAATIEIEGEGVVRFSDGSGRSAGIFVAHGSGVDTWSSLQIRLERRYGSRLVRGGPTRALVCGVAADATATPVDVVRNVQPDDLIRGGLVLSPIFASELEASGTTTPDELWRRLAS